MDSYEIVSNYEAFKQGACPRKCSNGIFNSLAISSSCEIEKLTNAYSYISEMLSNQPEREAALKLIKKAIDKQSDFEIAYRKMAKLLLEGDPK